VSRRRLILSAVLLGVSVAAFCFRERLEIGLNLVRQRVAKRSVDDRLREFGTAARERWSPFFHDSGIIYPPAHVVLVALKQERLLEVYAADNARTNFVRRFPILAASGGPGPKLRQGDQQVPEGFYAIESLNPNSAYHVALRLNYPNAVDRLRATKDGRTQLGGDIMIHGKSVSIGCLAMGDQAAEDLFTLAADVGLRNVTVISSPIDFRRHQQIPGNPQLPAWTSELYAGIAQQLNRLPAK
jgi:murein L,D-transpeptidase YafK